MQKRYQSPDTETSLLRKHGSSLFIGQNNLLDRIGLVLQVLCIVVRVGGEEELYRHSAISEDNQEYEGDTNEP